MRSGIVVQESGLPQQEPCATPNPDPFAANIFNILSSSKSTNAVASPFTTCSFTCAVYSLDHRIFLLQAHNSAHELELESQVLSIPHQIIIVYYLKFQGVCFHRNLQIGSCFPCGQNRLQSGHKNILTSQLIAHIIHLHLLRNQWELHLSSMQPLRNSSADRVVTQYSLPGIDSTQLQYKL